MMCASTGAYLEDANGITTDQCLAWLIQLRRDNPNAIFVSYAFSYDRTKILRDIVFSAAGRAWHLWRNNSVPWTSDTGSYLVGGIDKKWFQVSSGGVSCKVYDVSSYWQTSFVNALASAGIVDAEIAAMKQQRNVFTADQMDEIRHYCFQECDRLTQLMDWLRDAFLSVELPQGRWHGPGAIAEATLRKHNVGSYHRHELTYGGEIGSVCRCAYFGGRAQTLLLGTVPEVWQYDIVSAYPNVTRGLPTARGSWVHSHSYTESPWAVWLVRWNIPGKLNEGYFGPFPWRNHNGSLWYPRNGYGWYWQPEVSLALRMWPDCIHIERGYIFHPESDDKPFRFIDEMFAMRRRLKQQKHAGQLALKLSMNSIYGKLAQGVGGKNGRVPRWQSYFWAGNITSATRAQLLHMADSDRENVIGFATDSVFYRTEQAFTESHELGGLELTYFTDAFFAQQGMYQGYIDGTPFEKTRSFMKGGLDWEDIRNGWSQFGTDYTSRRPMQLFMSLGLSCARGDFDSYGQWRSVEKALSLFTVAHQRSEIFGDPTPDELGQKRAMFLGGTRYDTLSAPYKKKHIHTNEDLLRETGLWSLA